MKIPTIKRRKWHRNMKWEVTDHDGFSWAAKHQPLKSGFCLWMIAKVPYAVGKGYIPCPRFRRPPADWTKTLRRIEPVKRTQNKKGTP